MLKMVSMKMKSNRVAGSGHKEQRWNEEAAENLLSVHTALREQLFSNPEKGLKRSTKILSHMHPRMHAHAHTYTRALQQQHEREKQEVRIISKWLLLLPP